jgi:hypothetical protein
MQRRQTEGQHQAPQKDQPHLCLLANKFILIGVFIKRTVRSALAVFHKQVAANPEIVRPGRREKRKRRPPKLFHMNYKDV